ncbi:flagellar basal body L-ring protein FlgH [bacterium]|nr:flagellar basal body L-ring protein FlgH [bacterium]
MNRKSLIANRELKIENWKSLISRTLNLEHRTLNLKKVLVFLLMANMLFAKSLWMEGDERCLFSDRKAGKIGDIVTVVIVEEAKASNMNSSKRDKNLEVTTEASGALAFLPKVGGKGESKFKRGGAVTRAGSLQAKVTAQVISVLPNGNLRIEGERKIKIDNEEETIYVSGIARPEDIQAQNVIMSTYLAEAKIEYRGAVSLSSKEKPNVGVRVLQKLIGWMF